MFTVDMIVKKIKSSTGVSRITDRAYKALQSVGKVLEYDPDYRFNNCRLIRIKGIDDTRLFIATTEYGEYYLDEYVSY
ncbi:MAG: hypothetical protein EOL88_08115 [Bacteroidia bacterium]|nr:hypothetical protein [Bacteroidia bacterium]